jgi:HPt (histidine-containing phosphotransfer) domain-containing protein
MLPPPAHDSGSGWVASPFLYGSFIRNSPPVYPGAFAYPLFFSHVIEGLFAASAELPGPPVSEMAEGEIINWHAALRAVGGNPRILRTVVDAELVEIPCLMESIRRAVTDGDAKALRFAAHTLKGSPRYFGKTLAFEEVLQLEKMGEDESLTEAGATLVRLESEILRINQVLHEYLQKESGE